MRRLSSLGSKQLAHRKGRSALTAIGIVLGVAILFGVLIANATTSSGVDRLIKDFTGNANVLVSAAGAFDAVVPADLVQHLASLPGVKLVVGSFRFLSGVRTAAGNGPIDISVRGIELAQSTKLQTYSLLGGAFFAPGAREGIIPDRLARKLGLKRGDRFGVSTPSGVQQLHLVGILDDTGAGRTNQGDVVFTSLATARALAGKGTVISGASMILNPGIKTDTWITQHRNQVGPGLDVQNAETLAQGFKGFLNILGAVFTFFAAITLFVGTFLIYLTLSMAIVERVRMYGTLRALGATRRQVRRTVMAEAVTLGAISTAFGLLAGLLIAKGLLALMSGLFKIDLPGLTITPGAVITGILVGLLTTVVSSLIPARRAGRLSPVVAMKGDYAAGTRLSRAWIAGIAAAIGGILLGVTGNGAGIALGAPMILLGAVLLTPLLLPYLARVLGRVTDRLARGVGEVAVHHLVKERGRSAYTLALVMVVMAMIFSIGGLNVTLRHSLEKSIDREFGADLQVSAPGSLDAHFEPALCAIPGVGELTTLRFARVSILPAAGSPPATQPETNFARIIDPSSYFRLASFDWVKGNDHLAEAALRAGNAILLPEGRAVELKTGVGKTLRIRTQSGPRDFHVAATYATFSGPPEIIVGLPDGLRYFGAHNAGSYQVNAARGANPATVKTAIEHTLGARYNLTVKTSTTLKADATEQFGRFFNIFYAILFVAAIVGLLGLANTLAMSVLQRYREIGILRAIGTTRSQVRRMVLVESATLSLVAFVLSLPLGLLLSIVVVRGISAAFGFSVSYIYPAAWVPVIATFGIIVSVLAAIAPGRRAAKLEVVSALQYE